MLRTKLTTRRTTVRLRSRGLRPFVSSVLHYFSKAPRKGTQLFAASLRLPTNCPDRAYNLKKIKISFYFLYRKLLSHFIEKWLNSALSTKTNSTVPTYADEFVFVKSELISRRLPACRQVCLHAAVMFTSPG